MTRSPDLFSDPLPLLREVDETMRLYFEVKERLPEFTRQFLEAKRRYRHFQELVLLRRELWIRSSKRLEELARVRRVLRQQESGLIQPSDPEADPQRSRLAQNLKESFLKLEKIRELIRLGESLFYRQRRALKSRRQAAAAQVLPDPEMRDNALRLQKLKELFRLQRELIRRQERALCEHDDASAVQHRSSSDQIADDLPKQPDDSQPNLAPCEECEQRQDSNPHRQSLGFQRLGYQSLGPQSDTEPPAPALPLTEESPAAEPLASTGIAASNTPQGNQVQDLIVRGPPCRAPAVDL